MEKKKKNIFRDQKIKKMIKELGLSYGSTAKMFGLSRARIHQIVSGYSSSKRPKQLYREVLIRDEMTCQWKKACNGKLLNIKDLVIHHINFNTNDNRKTNLITLCKKCHLLFHANNHIDERKLKQRVPKDKKLIAEIERLQNQGKSLRQISEQVNKSHEWVRIELKKLDIKTSIMKEGGDNK